MQSDNSVNININTQQTGQTGQSGQSSDVGAGESLTMLMQLFLQGKKGTDGAAPAGSATAVQERLQLIIQNGNDKTKIDITIDTPTLPTPDDKLVSIAIDLIASGAIGENHPLSVLIKATTDQIIVNANVSDNSMVAGIASAGGGNVPPEKGCAFLGGLVMVALAEILANFAKQQSSMSKEMATLWATTQSMLKDLAECMAENILQKAETDAKGDIMQAVLAGIGAGISIGGAMGSMGLFAGATKALRAEPDSIIRQLKMSNITTQAQSMGTIANSSSTLFTQSGASLVKADVTLQDGVYDAKQKMMENVQQQLQAMVDKYSQGESDAHKAKDDALDLLKNMMDALYQAFRGIAGGHT